MTKTRVFILSCLKKTVYLYLTQVEDWLDGIETMMITKLQTTIQVKTTTTTAVTTTATTTTTTIIKAKAITSFIVCPNPRKVQAYRPNNFSCYDSFFFRHFLNYSRFFCKGHSDLYPIINVCIFTAYESMANNSSLKISQGKLVNVN